MSEGSAPKAKECALIVVNYGSSPLLAKNLGALTLAELGGQIVIVDNYTSSQEVQAVEELASAQHWTLLALESNRGFGAAVNAGAELAFARGARAMAVLNPDAHIESEALLRLLQAVVEDSNLIVSPTIQTSDGRTWFDGMDLYVNSGRVASRRRPVAPTGPHEPWISGACFAVSRTLWQLVGGFDEDYFLYWEDVDLSRRVIKSGGRLTVSGSILAVHDPGGTQTRVGGVRTKSEVYYFYNIRNRLVYAAKHLEAQEIRRWIYATPRVSYEILLAGGRRQFFSSFAPLRAYFTGIIDGLRMILTIRSRTQPPGRIGLDQGAGDSHSIAAAGLAHALKGQGRT
ncbi:glycosyltransferase family 2 protein [Arthrobacter sp. H35-D1]|uniref:glycosyltransferase family 2 protein n=1 Tax=Arthrobacter sp. H35-D1 TaxID=3046202 RepID=UPI0024BAEE09|nr:glycosyltransferase family 2 protein [Arthrobacter sp. H35-D1]MDJ0312340.1 glycosyltransferase family 2 protein [Arthrobacter sp. H35-D1]